METAVIIYYGIFQPAQWISHLGLRREKPSCWHGDAIFRPPDSDQSGLHLRSIAKDELRNVHRTISLHRAMFLSAIWEGKTMGGAEQAARREQSDQAAGGT
jgi:hypothetical protein